MAQDLLSGCKQLSNPSISFYFLFGNLEYEFFILNFYTLQVEDNICKFAKKGLTPSQIGVILRDSHGIAQVKSVTGSKILRVLKAHGDLCSANVDVLYVIFDD